MAKLMPLEKCDAQKVEALLDAAFGADRHGRTAYMLRAGMNAIDALSFALVEEDELIGTIQCWPVQIANGSNIMPLILVGPVAVHPDHQRGGHGHSLMHATLAAAENMGDPAMLLIGDAEYYGRFGFTADATAGWQLPGPWEAHRLLCRNPAGHDLLAQGTLGPRA